MEGFRNFIKGKFGKFLLIAIFASFIAFGVDSVVTNFNANNAATLAKVGRVKISDQQFEQTYKPQEQELLGRLGGDSSLLNVNVLKKQVLDQLVNQAILDRHGKELNLGLDTKSVLTLIRKEPSFQDNGQFSEEKLQLFLRERGITAEQLIADLQRQNMQRELKQGLIQSAFSLPKEQAWVAATQLEKRNVQTLTFAVAPRADVTATISTSEMHQYYKAHPELFALPETADFNYIVLDRSAVQAAAPTEEELKAAYQTKQQEANKNTERHIQHIAFPFSAFKNEAAAKAEATRVYALIKPESDFSALVKQYSKDPAAQFDQGDLGFMNSSFDPAFAQALSGVAKGGVSLPFKAQDGYHIAKVIDVKADALPAFEQMKTTLQQEVAAAKAEASYTDAIAKLNDTALDAQDLLDVAKVQNLSIDRYTGVKNDTSNLGELALFNAAPVRDVAFSSDSVLDRRVTTGIELSKNRMMWLQVTKHQDKRTQRLTEAMPKLKEMLALEKVAKMQLEQAQKAVALINKGTPIAQVTQQYPAVIANVGEITRTSTTSSAVLNAAFSALTPKAGSALTPKAGQMSAVVVKPNAKQTVQDVVVVLVSQVTPATPAEIDTLKTQLAGDFSQVSAGYELKDYMESLKARYKVKVTAQFNASSSDDKK